MNDRSGGKAGVVLYVAPDPDGRGRFERELSAVSAFDVVLAASVAEALGTLETERVDCIVSEYDLPDVDGVVFLQTIRAQYPELPFILFTDAGSEEVASRAITAGATDYLTKERAEGEWDHLATLVAQAIEYHDRRRPVSDPDLTVRAVLEATADATAIVRDDAFLYVDEETLDLLAADSRADLDGVVPTDLFAADPPSVTADTFEQIQSGERRVDRSRRSVVSLDGESTPVELTATAITWNGEPAVLLICRDITSRRDRQARLRRFRRAAEAAGHAIYITDPDGTITYVNPAFEEITGYEASEAVGRNPRILNSGEMPAEYFEELWETVTAGEVWEEVVINERKNGEQYYASQTISPILEDDDVVAYVAIQTDITERKRREEEFRHYKQAVESATDMLAAVDPDYRFLFANAQYREFHDLPAEGLTGTTLSDVLTDSDFEAVRTYIDRALDGETIELELTRTSAAGDERRLALQLFPLNSEQGTVQGVGAAMRDITERRQREEHVAQLSEIRRVISRINQQLVRATDTEEMIPTAAEVLSSSDLFTCTFITLLDDGPEFVCESGSDLDEGRIRDFHTDAYVEAVFEAGVLWMDNVTEPPFAQHDPETPDHAGLALAVEHEDEQFGVLTVHFPPDVEPTDEEIDLLETVASDIGFFLHSQELERDLGTFKEIAERIDDPVMLQDGNGRFQVVNEAVTEFADMSREELIGADEYGFMDEETAAFVEEMKARTVHGEEPVSYQVTTSFPEKGTRVFSTARYPHYDEEGEVDGTIAICRDVTDLKEHQRQLQVIDRVLRHNVNNDMNVIQGFASMIRERGSGEIEEYAQKILNNSEKLLTTADKEREITKFLADPPPTETIDITPAVEATVGNIREQYPDADVSADTTGGCAVRATAAITQAIEELLRNAIIHSDRHHPSAEVRCERQGNEVRLQVADDGPGIPDMEREVLTGSTEIDPLYHGSGLGLWLVNLIVQQSDGSVECTSNEPRGTVVTICLPAE